ncbi:MAG: fibrinogen-like YCDxxxxGGGW domain-containing protein [Candidatus Gracilibacteria bacterium]|nr:fibrinogen-like YCDxxxxGGGW domain-containing protein [Candidatus Gracilibacteria bacterium]
MQLQKINPTTKTRKNELAFTLVELIVVIAILAILGTIAFMSLQGYSRDARDSVRVSDMSRIKTSLELFNIESGKYPDPTEAQPITYSGGLAWYQGIFGNSTFVNVSKLDKIPLDPITEKQYSYSVLNTKQEYELGGIMEGEEISMIEISETNASQKTAKAKISGNYNGLSLRVNTNSISYVLAIPSITTSIDLSQETNRNLETIIPAKELVLTNYRNLPSNYNNSNYTSNQETTNTDFQITSGNSLTNAILFEGDLKDLTSSIFITKLQQAYSGTTVKTIRGTNELLSVNTSDTNSMESIDKVGVTYINKYLGGSAVNKIYATCDGIAHNTTKSFYTGTGVTFTVGTCDGLKQDFICKDGVWKNGETILDTNTYAYETCTVESGATCTHLGTEMNHGDNMPVYSVESIAWDATENCTDTPTIQGQVTCNDGTVTGDTGYAYKVCAKGTPNNCSADASYDDGGALLQTYDVPQLNHGLSYTGNLDIPENNGTFRYSLDVICNNGTLSPTETGPEYQSCNAGYFWNTSTCNIQWTGNATTGYLYKNTSGVEQYPTSCSDLLAQSTWKNTYTGSPWNGTKFNDGVYWIKPASTVFKVYCDMTSDGGGWTMVVAQFESDPVTNWNEGIQGDYDPTLATSKGFALNTSQITTHNQIAFGKDKTSTFVDYVNGFYSTSNIDTTLVKSPKTGFYYQIHRNTGSLFDYHNPEEGSNNIVAWNNTLTFDKIGGRNFSWAFSVNQTTQDYRGYGLNGDSLSATSESYPWTVWVRESSGTFLVGNNGGFMWNNGTYSTSCKSYKDNSNYNSEGNGVYWIKPDSGAAFKVYCDMTTDGGGWTLVLNYLHKGGTNPSLNIRNNSAPIYNGEILGTDQSGTEYWGHMNNATISRISFTQTQWFCKTSFHNRVIHFKNSGTNVNNYIKTGIGTMDIFNNSTNLNKYSNASLPNNFDNLGTYSSQGDIALTEFPFYGNSTIGNPRAHWGIKGLSDRWECDDQPLAQGGASSFINNTFHQVFVR